MSKPEPKDMDAWEAALSQALFKNKDYREVMERPQNFTQEEKEDITARGYPEASKWADLNWGKFS